MKISQQEHYRFLEDAIREETNQFEQKLDSSAAFLREEKGELFLAQFIKFEDGELILKFSNKYSVPRNGEYLYCFTVSKELRNPQNWINITYGDLLKNKGYYSQVVCIWQTSLHDNPEYCLVGFRGVDTEFAEHIDGHAGIFLVLGPDVPPFQYLHNLQSIVRHNRHKSIENIIEGEIADDLEIPIQDIPAATDVAEFILAQLSLSDSVLLQGPPGTGKTTQIARICRHLCEQGQSVLVTALTNRALIEVAGKKDVAELLEEGKIHKTKLSVDESKELPKLRNMKIMAPEPGQIVLSTFYISSGEASNLSSLAIGNPPFDVVIMDEASQALLAMFAATKLLGKKCIFVGDTNQLPPIVKLPGDRKARKSYHCCINGLAMMGRIDKIPSYRMTQTYRLPPRAAHYTGLFYDGSLISCVNSLNSFSYPEMRDPYGKFFHQQGGPSLIKMDLPLGDKKPIAAMVLAAMLVAAIIEQNPKQKIAVLSFNVDTTKALQKVIYQTIGNHNNLLIETVSRIQGLTTEVVIYVVPNTVYSQTLNRQLFNVATSRATRHTVIIIDRNYHNDERIDRDVLRFLDSLSDASYYIPAQADDVQAALEAPCDVYKEEIGETEEIVSESKDAPVEDSVETKKNTPAESKDENFIPTEVPPIGVKVVGKIDLSRFDTPKPKKKEKDGCYIIDTNVFVDCPDILYKIGRNYLVILSIKVIDELDKLKVTLSDEEKASVKKALYIINKLMDSRGISLEVADMRLLPMEFDRRSPDNMILAVALRHQDENPTLLTSDNGLQLKAKGLGIKAQSLATFMKYW